MMENLSFSHPNANEVIATNFCTCHDSCAVLACAKFCSDWMDKMELQQDKISIKFELWWKKISEMEP